MTRRKALLAAAGLAALVALAVLVARRPATGEASGPAWGFRFGLPAGVALRYRFEVEAEQAGDAPALGAVGGTVALSGAFTLQAAGPAAAGGQEVRLRLDGLDRHEVKVLGKDLLADAGRVREEAAAGELWFTLRESGRLDAPRLSRDASLLVKMLAPFLLAAMEVELPRGSAEEVPASWNATARGLSGTAEVAYTRGARHSLQRRLSGYREILAPLPSPRPPVKAEGGASVALDPRGFLARLDGSERLEVAGPAGGEPAYSSRGRLEVRLEGEAPAPAPRLPPAEALASLDPRYQGDAASRRKHLETMAKDFSAQDLDISLDLVASGISPPHDWFFGAAARLELEPALADRLERRFREMRGNPGVRLAILDLLRAVGTPAAQQTLAALVRDSAERRPKGWLADVQRLGQVDRPGPEVRALASERWRDETAALDREGTTPEYRASALTLGSVAWRAAQAGDRDAAASLVEPIIDALRETSDRDRTVALIASLGNAGAEEALPVLESGAKSEDPAIRAAAVAATRRLEGPAAQEIALRLLGDPAPAVQESALRTIDFRGGGTDASAAVCRAIVEGRIAPANGHDAIVLLEKNLAEADRIPAFRPALERLAAPGEGDVANRARLALVALMPWGQ